MLIGSTLFVALTAGGLWLVACGVGDSPSRKSQAPSPEPRTRIVSLSPALTDILIDLGLGDHIVGRDNWEERLPPDVPRVGDLHDFNYEAVLSLRPTDLVLQAGRSGLPPKVREIASQRGWNVINLHIDGLEDISTAVRRLASELSFDGDEALRERTIAAAERLIEAIEESLTPLPSSVRTRLGPVLLLYGVNPPSAFGPGSYLSDVLERLGGSNALKSGGPWQELDLEAVAARDPWAIVLVRPTLAPGSAGGHRPSVKDEVSDGDGHPQAKPGANGAPRANGMHSQPAAARFGPLVRLRLSAIEGGRIAVLTHPQALLPGSSIIEVADELRATLLDLSEQRP